MEKENSIRLQKYMANCGLGSRRFCETLISAGRVKVNNLVVKELGTKINHIMRHTVGLYHGQVGSKEWKRYLSDNMMARDSDFQKAKHIMTIVQNNEKAIQANS